MKRSCKQIDITDPLTVFPWVFDCIRRHKKRYDFRRMLIRIGGLEPWEYVMMIDNDDYALLISAAENVAKEATRRIKIRSLDLPPVTIRERVDSSSGKVRLIGCEDAFQQVLDYIAVGASEEIFRRRIVPQQMSSIKGRGAIKGIQMISKWMIRDQNSVRYARKHGLRYTRKTKYHMKLDITKCYPSARVERFLNLFRRDCGNETLIWLWSELLRSHQIDGYEGFMIGAVSSQWAVQYMISFIYRHAMNLYQVRRGRRIKLIYKMMIYLDDMLITGSARRSLKKAAIELTRYAYEILGFTIKSNWSIQAIDNSPIDYMGYVIYANGKIAIRARVFLRLRRAALRVIHTGKMYIQQARKIVAYKGYVIYSMSRKIRKKYDLIRIFNFASYLISSIERSKRDENIIRQGA